MGGRGGSSRTAPTVVDSTSPQSYFERWARGDKPIDVRYVGGNVVQVTLPDFDAHFIRDRPGVYRVVEDTNDAVLFSGKSPSEVWHKISAHYGGRVDVEIERFEFRDSGQRIPNVKEGIFGAETGRLTSPAAKRYGVK